MALRLIELIVPSDREREVSEIARQHEIVSVWMSKISKERTSVRILLTVEDSESLLDKLESTFGDMDDFRIIVLSVEASVPRPEERQPKDGKTSRFQRVSREELYSSISDMTRLNSTYIVTMVLSVVVATVGILLDNIIVILAAIVLTPLLGPNLALSLGTTLADGKLSVTSLKALAIGIIIALAISIAIGYFVEVNTLVEQISTRLNLSFSDIILALASGSAGAILVTRRASATLVGVAMAAALLPPLVTFGLLVGSGNAAISTNTLLTFTINVICINLAGVLTFVAQDIRPLSWWEESKAKRSTIIAVSIWIVLLLVLIALVILAQE